MGVISTLEATPQKIPPIHRHPTWDTGKGYTDEDPNPLSEMTVMQLSHFD